MNKDLRHVRAALNKAFMGGYLAKRPQFNFLREIQTLPTYPPNN